MKLERQLINCRSRENKDLIFRNFSNYDYVNNIFDNQTNSFAEISIESILNNKNIGKNNIFYSKEYLKILKSVIIILFKEDKMIQ